ncbi:MAG: hypothetical protein MI753_12720 [Hyphomicrobiales bacterium]|nr:hypothetical protein [Hyphomicrobiales bacterium]
MGVGIWYLACFAFGCLGGLYAGYWGGIGLLILGAATYFMSPPRFRNVVTERHALIGFLLMVGVSAGILPALIRLGVIFV